MGLVSLGVGGVGSVCWGGGLSGVLPGLLSVSECRGCWVMSGLELVSSDSGACAVRAGVGTGRDTFGLLLARPVLDETPDPDASPTMTVPELTSAPTIAETQTETQTETPSPMSTETVTVTATPPSDPVESAWTGETVAVVTVSLTLLVLLVAAAVVGAWGRR